MGWSVVLNANLLAFAEGLTVKTALHVNTEGPPGHGIQLRLDQVKELRGIDPWPGLYISWRTKHLESERRLMPPSLKFRSQGPYDAQLVHEAMVVELFERLAANPRAAHIKLTPGWAGQPNVEWIEVDSFPEGEVAGQGAFRTAHVEQVVARRSAPGSLEYLLLWLASSPQRRLANTPAEVVLSRENLYARFGADTVRQLPRFTLRTRRGPADGDAVYIFGRRTRLVLVHRDDCPVRAALDEQLMKAERS